LAEALLADRRVSDGIAMLRSIKKTGPQGTVAGAGLAIAEIETNQLSAAEAEVNELIDRGARSVPEVMYARARLLLAQGKNSDAQQILKELTDIAPKYAPAFYYLGLTYADSGDFAKATDQLRTAARLAPSEPQTYMMLGNIDLKQGYYPAAIEESEHALNYAPDYVPALLLKGDALYGAGREQEASEVFRRLSQLAPQNSIVHERLGQLAAKRNDLNTATREFEAALRLDPSRVQVLNNLAVALWQTKGPQAALDRVRMQIKLQPANVDFHVLLATLLIKNHQPELAAQDLRTAVEKNPNAAGLYFILAQTYQIMGKTDKVEAELKTSLVKHPNYTPALMILASMADQAARYDEAVAYYQRLLAINPNFGVAANNLAYDYLRENKNLDQALDLAQRARQSMPHDPHVADTLGEAFLKRGLPDNAVPLLRESIKANGSAASPHYHLGFALVALKQTDEATRELNAALKLGPTADDAVEARAELARMANGASGSVTR
jgi:tetratricopeptide (TPR) repeat protein